MKKKTKRHNKNMIWITIKNRRITKKNKENLNKQKNIKEKTTPRTRRKLTKNKKKNK